MRSWSLLEEVEEITNEHKKKQFYCCNNIYFALFWINVKFRKKEKSTKFNQNKTVCPQSPAAKPSVIQFVLIMIILFAFGDHSLSIPKANR